MRCLCGYIEPEDWEEQVEVLYLSGKRKGELKEVKIVYHEVQENEKFIPITVEKDFGFLVKRETYCGQSETQVRLYACPKCFTVRMEDF